MPRIPCADFLHLSFNLCSRISHRTPNGHLDRLPGHLLRESGSE